MTLMIEHDKKERLQVQKQIRHRILDRIHDEFFDKALANQTGDHRVQDALNQLQDLLYLDDELNSLIVKSFKLILLKKKQNNASITDSELLYRRVVLRYCDPSLVFSYDQIADYSRIPSDVKKRAKKYKNIPLSVGEDRHTSLLKILQSRKPLARRNIKKINAEN